MKSYIATFLFLFISVLALQSCKKVSKKSEQHKEENAIKSNFVYLSDERLEKVKILLKEKDTFFTKAYQELIVNADLELDKIPDPVTNKTQTPPSGDKHDFMTIAPYRWPNPNTKDGFPWIVKDGEINPMARGKDTDHIRLREMFSSLDNLSMAYYFSDDIKYANKAKSILKTWFIDEATKVNPNLNYGQGIPGEVEGRRAGMISWHKIAVVVNSVQLLEAHKVLNLDEMQVLNKWFLDYYTWAKTNRMGIENDNGKQNHSTNYDFILVGLARYLGLNAEAISRLEAAKAKRIDVQLQVDGKQPYELGRTKSVHYSSMNLRFMTLIAEMGMPLNVDLWSYSTPDGKSIKKAYDFLRPFAEGKEKWTYRQITEGGPQKAIENEMIPLFSIASTIFNEQLIDKSVKAHLYLDYLDKLKYPPLFKLK
ncbi:alginate lyase family protein [Polaribacter sp. L3A8]|uniref:alginate lyase family protein n=1 Tax=Polaribacter sp. L3A8 TaxID=2686361 RepID=UPI00131E0434|nr:alginate lyase family protein [Polaribacter sp. L3A8]